MTTPAAEPRQNRLAFVDNLRWVMIVLVVSMHAAVTYSHLGSWYFMEDPKPGLGGTLAFATYQTFLQAFFMGLLFLIAGYFVPVAYDRKGFARFLRERAVRLGAPSLLFMVFVHPITVYWLLHEAGGDQRPPLSQAYWPYLSSGRFLEGSGPMWFTLALLFFSTTYGLVRLLRPASGTQEPAAPLPGDREIIALAAVMGCCTFLVRIVQPMGTNVLNMQLCYFSQYILLFAVGLIARRRDWLLRIPYALGMRWLKIALSLGSIVWVLFVIAVVRTNSQSSISGGVTWPSAVMSFWESFFCVGVCLGVIVWFRERFNRQGGWLQWMSDNCFAVYLFHTPLLITVTLGLRTWAAPKGLKFLVATTLGLAVSYLASSLVFRRIPILKRVL